jgi:hypothetical protein
MQILSRGRTFDDAQSNPTGLASPELDTVSAGRRQFGIESD